MLSQDFYSATVGSVVMTVYVCVFVYPRAYLRNYTPDLR